MEDRKTHLRDLPYPLYLYLAKENAKTSGRSHRVRKDETGPSLREVEGNVIKMQPLIKRHEWMTWCHETKNERYDLMPAMIVWCVMAHKRMTVECSQKTEMNLKSFLMMPRCLK